MKTPIKPALFLVLAVLAGAAIFWNRSVNNESSMERVSAPLAEKADTAQGTRPEQSILRSAELLSARPLESAGGAAAEPLTELTSMKGAESLPQTEQASLWTAFSEARREIRPLTDHQRTMPENEGAGFLASNPSQKIRVRFLDDGVRLLSAYPNRDWEGVLSLGVGYGAREIRQKGTQLEYVHDDIVEYYHNRRDGIEHGYIIEQPTADVSTANGTLVIPIQVAGLTVEPLAERTEGSHDLQFVNKEGEAVLSYSDLKVWDADGHNLLASMSLTSDGLVIEVAAADARYPIVIDPLIASLEQKLGLEVTGTENDNFGWSVSVSGDTALIGAQGDDDEGTESGSAYVFVRSGVNWTQQQKLAAADASADDRFGFSVSVSGNTALIGAFRDDDAGTDSGSAYVFVRTGSSWTQKQKLTAIDAAGGDWFGYSVSVSGDTALIGANLDDDAGSKSGSAYVFVTSGVNWTQEQKLTATDAAGGDNFGRAVSVLGDTALIGAYGDNDAGSNSGSAYVFVRSGVIWAQEQKLTASDASGGDNFGWSVSVSGDTALISAYGDNHAGSYSGSAYVFVRSGVIWAQEQKLTASDAAGVDLFGYSVSVSGDAVLIGAYGDKDAGTSSGSAYVFVRSAAVWSEEQKLTAGDGAEGDNFGRSVSLDGDTVLIGAPLDDDSGANNGSAYVFVQNAGVWSEEQNIIVVPTLGDEFGAAVSVDGNTALIGVPGDDTSSFDGGAVYVFVRGGSVWDEQQMLFPDDGQQFDRFGSAVSLSGDIALVGMPNYERESAYLFERSGDSWSQKQKLTPSSGEFTTGFGQSVCVDGTTAIVGAPEDNFGGGSAYVFVLGGGGGGGGGGAFTWAEQQVLQPSDGGGFFGSAVGLDGNNILVGAPLGGNDVDYFSGNAYVFVRSGSTWSEQQILTATASVDSYDFGISVSISGSSALVGMRGDDLNGFDTGSAFIFTRSGLFWSPQQKLTASDGMSSDAFGQSVSLVGDRALIGASGDESSRGSAYLFFRTGSSWAEEQKLFASNGASSDGFGNTVSLSGNFAVVGASGFDGYDSQGNLAAGQGAAYIYRVPLADFVVGDEGASEAWETANGFDPNVDGDISTLDSDNDGDLDILEIFQGTDRNGSGESFGFQQVAATSGVDEVNAQYRRSTTQTAVQVVSLWSCDLVNWYSSGESAGGITVTTTETVVESGAGYEVIEASTEVTSGESDCLFYRLELVPVE